MSRRDIAPLESKRLAQVSFVVPDVESVATTLAGLFGLAVPEIQVTDSYDDTGVQFKGEPTDARAKLAFLELDNVTIELIEPIGSPNSYREALDDRGPGLHHLGFHTTDMERDVGRLEAGGASPVQSGRFRGGRYTHLEGYGDFPARIELLQFDDEEGG